MVTLFNLTSRNLRRPALQLVVVIALAASAPAVWAQPGGANTLRSSLAEGAGPGHSKARPRHASRQKDQAAQKRPEPNVAPAEAARRAAREYGGRVLNVVLEDGPGGPYYRVKLLDGGRVRVVHVEARQ